MSSAIPVPPGFGHALSRQHAGAPLSIQMEASSSASKRHWFGSFSFTEPMLPQSPTLSSDLPGFTDAAM